MFRKFFYLMFTIIFLNVCVILWNGIAGESNIIPEIKNPMEEIGFYKDHVYDFLNIVNVDVETGAGLVKIPLGSIKGKGAGSTTFYINYTAYSNVEVANYSITLGYSSSRVNGIFSITDGNLGYLSLGCADSAGDKLNKDNMKWRYFIPSLSQQGGFEDYCLDDKGKPKFHLRKDPDNIEFRDENGVTHILYLTKNDLGSITNHGYENQCYFLSGDGNYRSGIFRTRKSPYSKECDEINLHWDQYNADCYDGLIYTTGGVVYSNLYNNHKKHSGCKSYLCDSIPKIIEKQDLEGNWVKWDFTGKEKRIFNNQGREIKVKEQISGEEKTVSVKVSGKGTTKLYYWKVPDEYYQNSNNRWEQISAFWLPKEFLTKIVLPDGSFYRFEYYNIRENKVTRREGEGYFKIGKKYRWNSNLIPISDSSEIKDAEIIVPLLKKIVLPTGGSIEFKYKIYGISTETEVWKENIREDANNNIFKGIETLAYALPRYGETEDKEIHYIAHIGVGELIYRDKDGRIIERRNYKSILPYRKSYEEQDGMSILHYELKNVNEFQEYDLLSKRVDGYLIETDEEGKEECKSSFFILKKEDGKLTITSIDKDVVRGRRIETYDSANHLIKKEDIIGGNLNFNFRKPLQGLYDDVTNQERRYITYLHPEESGDYSREERIEKYYPKLIPGVFIPYSGGTPILRNSGLIFKIFEEDRLIDNNGNIIKKSIKSTSYRGLDCKIQKIESDKILYSYFNENTKGIVYPVGSYLTIYEGNKKIYEQQSYSEYENDLTFPWENFGKSIPRVKRSVLTKQTQIGNNTENSDKLWLTETEYDNIYPWRKIKEKIGLANKEILTIPDERIIKVWKDFVIARPVIKTTYTYNGKYFEIFYDYYTDDARKGLLKTRQLSLSGEGIGSPSSVTEEFDYSYGELSKYVLKSADNSLTLTTTREIDPSTGWVTKQTNPDGTYTTYQYDDMGRLTKIDSSITGITDSTIDYISYDASSGRPAQVKLHGLIEGHYYYDGLGRLKYAGENNGGGWEWSRIDYLGLNLKRKEWGGAKSTTLSGIGNWNAITSHKEYTYDGFGRVTAIKTYAKGNILHDTIQTLYDGFYKTTILKDSSGTIKEVKKVQYDAENRIKTVWIGESLSGLIKKLSYEYHPLFGKMTSAKLYQEDGATIGQTRTWEYDKLGNLTTSVTPEEGVITYSNYNIFGKWGKKEWGGTKLFITYDGLGREDEIRGTKGWLLRKTAYGKQGASNGKITAITRKNGYGESTITYIYNNASGVLRGTLSKRKYNIKLYSWIIGDRPIILNRTISYGYDTNKGLLKQIVYPSETISGITNLSRKLIFTYTNPGSLIKGVTLKAEGGQYTVERELINGVNYLSFGSIQYGMGDGTLNTILNDSLGRLQSIKVNLWGEQTLSEYQYPSYDIKGNILKIKEQRYNSHSDKLEGRTIEYAYDQYNRLTRADYMQGIWQTINGKDRLTGNIGYREDFGYDYAGNLIYKSFENPTSYGFKTIQTFDLSNAKPADNNNRLPVQEHNYNYDAKGNIVKITYPDRTVSLKYDALNMVRLTEVTYHSDGHKERYGYIYDGEGKRVCKIKFGSDNKAQNVKVYIRDGNGKILEELKNTKGENGNWQGFKWVKDYYWIWDKLISTAEKE